MDYLKQFEKAMEKGNLEEASLWLRAVEVGVEILPKAQAKQIIDSFLGK